MMSNKFRRQAKRGNIERARSKKHSPKVEPCPLCRQLHSSTFLEGVASIMDILGVLAPTKKDVRNAYGIVHSIEEADANAIANDWEHVGRDLYEVLNDSERRKALSPASY
jgi:hypothetical protein